MSVAYVMFTVRVHGLDAALIEPLRQEIEMAVEAVVTSLGLWNEKRGRMAGDVIVEVDEHAGQEDSADPC